MPPVTRTSSRVRGPDVSLTLVNESTGATVASQVELALDRAGRRRGLLGRDGLAPASAMVLSPCWMVHTAFMRFAIDVVFVDRGGCVVHVATDLQPWRAAMSTQAHAVIELPAGAIRKRSVNVGDRLSFFDTDLDGTMTAAAGTLPLEVRPC